MCLLTSRLFVFSPKGVTLDKFSEMIRGNLSKMERLKLVALVTIEVHTILSHTKCMYIWTGVYRSMLVISLRNF